MSNVTTPRSILRRLVHVAFTAAALIVVTTTMVVALDLRSPAALIALADARFHVGILCLILAAGAMIARAKRIAALLLGCAIWHVGPAVAISFGGHPPAADEPSLVVATLNCFYGNVTPARVETFARDGGFDLLAVQEVSPSMLRAIEALRDVYPHRVLQEVSMARPDRPAFGLGLLSRHPIREHHIVSGGENPMPFVLAIVDTPAGAVQVVTLHSLSPHEAPDKRASLFEGIAAALDPHAPAIVLGDFNATLYAQDLKHLLLQANLRDTRHGFGRIPTLFDPRLPDLLGIDIDRVLVRGFAASDVRAGPRVGSDHRPVIAELGMSVP